MKSTTAKDSVLSQIQKEHLRPIPRIYFQVARIILWSIIASILFVAIFFGLFLLNDATDLFRLGRYGTDGMIPSLFPSFFWGVLFLSFILIGIFSFRKTTNGYRYTILKNCIIFLGIVLLGVGIFRFLGVGPLMHAYLAENIPFLSDTVYRMSSWNEPENGRIAGTIQSRDTDSILLQSLDGKTWKIYIATASRGELVKIEMGEKVRIFGTMKSTDSFEADRIFPWFGQGGKKRFFQFFE